LKATYYGNVDIVSALIQANAKLDLVDALTETTLMIGMIDFFYFYLIE
jgi:hypothetical protein